jgi:hypothetical protein
MNKLYLNPGAWLALIIFAGLTFLFFRNCPIVASIFYTSAVVFFVGGRIRSWWHLRKQGYRARWHGRDSLYYEEVAGGQFRRLVIGGELMARGSRLIYFPNEDDWQQNMPDWAKSRREEIFDRIRAEFGSKRFRYIETQSKGP